MSKSDKNWPNLRNHEEIDEFVADADLAEYDWGTLEPVSHEFENKTARVNMRLPESQLAEIKAEAKKRGIKYQRFMRELMQRGMQSL